MDNEVPDYYQKKQQEMLGTTIMAIKYDGGIVLGADSRTTSGTFVASRCSDKIEYIHDRIFALVSGSAADSRIITKIVKAQLQQHAIELGQLPQVKTAVKLFQQLMYQYKDQLESAVIVGGWDPVVGPSLYSLPMGGSCLEKNVCLGGSGSGYITGFVDVNYRENYSLQESKQMVLTAISQAMKHDGSSGGIVRMVCISKDGVTREFIDYKNLPYKQ